MANDLKARDGYQNQQRKRDEIAEKTLAATEDLTGRLHALEKTQGAFVRSYIAGDTEGLAAETTKIAADDESARDQSRFQAEHTKLLNKLRKSMLDAEGNPILDIDQAPELEGVRQLWRDTYKAGTDTGGFYEGMLEANNIVLAVERKKNQEAQDEQQKVNRKQRKDDEDDTRVPNESASGAQPGNEAEAWRGYNTGIHSAAQMKQWGYL